MEQPLVFDMPPIPSNLDPGVRLVLVSLVESMTRTLGEVARRTDNVAIGTLAQRPAATGSHRFYWVTDAPAHMEFDDGEWRSI